MTLWRQTDSAEVCLAAVQPGDQLWALSQCCVLWGFAGGSPGIKGTQADSAALWLNLELLEDRLAPTYSYGMLSLGAPLTSVAQRADCHHTGELHQHGLQRQFSELVGIVAGSRGRGHFQHQPAAGSSGVFTPVPSGGSGTADGSVSLGKITDEPGTVLWMAQPWAFTTNFVDNYNNAPTSGESWRDGRDRRTQWKRWPSRSANDFGAGSVFLIAFNVVGTSAATAAINLQATTAGTNFTNGTTGALSTDPITGANLGPYTLTGGCI